MTVKASGLLSVVFRALVSSLGVAVVYTRVYPRRSAELSRASLTHFPLCPPVAHLGAGGRVPSSGR